MRCYRFHPVDTWFFRESRPQGSAGGVELASLFPPPPMTLLGALRTLAGDRAGIAWQDYADAPNAGLRARLGLGDDLGELDLHASLLSVADEPLFPLPGILLRRRDSSGFVRLTLGQPVHCDLGPRVRLPELSKAASVEGIDQSWISRDTFERLLRGETPQPDATVYTTGGDRDVALMAGEARLGIGRDSARGTASDGLLYQTRHLRPASPGLNVALYLSGADDLLPERATVRLGGEGRMAALSATKETQRVPLPASPRPAKDQRHFLLYLMSSARFVGAEGAPTWLLPGFVPDAAAEFTCWSGQLAGAAVRLHGCVVGKALRLGGWDLARQRPKPLLSLVPAGTTYFLSVEDGTALHHVFEQLHGRRLGENTRAGHGLVVCGLWPDFSPVSH